MDAIYYASETLMNLAITIVMLVTIVFLIWPHHLRNPKNDNKPFSRKMILFAGFVSLMIVSVPFSGVMALTEPASVKQARLDQEAAQKKAEQEKAATKKAAQAAERKREEEAKKPVVKTETKTQKVAYASTTKEDATLPKGQTRVATAGADGERAITYEVTYVEGKETKRKEVKNVITKQPITKVTLIGTYEAPAPAYTPAPTPSTRSNCDPNYSGCVPIASDVDCAGGSGNGPAYVAGPIKVIGSDIYGLDRDHNGIACE